MGGGIQEHKNLRQSVVQMQLPCPIILYLHTNTENFSHLIHSVSVHFPSCCSKPLWLFLIACVPLLCLPLEFHTSICWTQINCELSKVRLWFYIFISQPRLKLQKTQRILGYKIQSWVQDIPQRSPLSSSGRTEIIANGYYVYWNSNS